MHRTKHIIGTPRKNIMSAMPTMLPSFSESVFATVPGDSATVVMVPKQSSGGCAIAGIVMFIVVIALVVWLIVIFTRPSGSGTTVQYIANTLASKGAKDVSIDDVKKLQQDGDAIVMFHAEWCGYCKALAPTVDKFAKEYTGDVHKLDCSNGGDELNELLNSLNVNGFPTILMFSKGSVKEYSGDRSLESLKAFAA